MEEQIIHDDTAVNASVPIKISHIPPDELKQLKSASLDDLSRIGVPKSITKFSPHHKLKEGLKKKLNTYSQKLSHSNTDIDKSVADTNNNLGRNGKVDLTLPTNKIDRQRVLDEMKKRSLQVNDEGVHSIRKEHHRSASASEQPADNFIIVDTNLFDEPFDSNYDTEYDSIDGSNPQSTAEFTAQEIERWSRKLENAREELRQLQAARDENVKEYLATCDNHVLTEINSTQKIKTNFERIDQKSKTSIMILQRKIEKYQNHQRELEEKGAHGPRSIIKAMQESVRSGASSLQEAVSKPINQFIKKEKRNGSTDNVSAKVYAEDTDTVGSFPNTQTSDEETSSLGSNQVMAGQMTSTSSTSLQHQELTEQLNELNQAHEALKDTCSKLEASVQDLIDSLNEQRFLNKKLQTKVDGMKSDWNDFTELNQNELQTLKKELYQSGELLDCLEYRFAERANEIEEGVTSCSTRITKMEHQQQQQLQPNYLEAGNAHQLLTKFLNVVISIFAVLLIVVSTLSKFLLPFASTRTRILTSLVTVCAVIFLLKNTDRNSMNNLHAALNGLFYRPDNKDR